MVVGSLCSVTDRGPNSRDNLRATLLIPTDIPTGMKPAEAEALQRLAYGQGVLECGAWSGFSTIVLAQAAVTVHSVDWHRGDQHAGVAYSLPEYAANLARYGLGDRIIIHVGRFEDVLPTLRPRSFNGCFLDGQHDRASVARDLRLIEPLLHPPAWLAVHDFGLFEVEPAVREFVASSRFQIDTIIETLVVLRLPAHPLRRLAVHLLPGSVTRAIRGVAQRVA